MIDYQRIAEDIRAAIACGDREARALLAESAADFSVAAEEVNARLKQCGELLHRGLRDEAIQLCEREPNLLDAVATLDLPECADWRAKLRQRQIANPPELNLDIAAELNEAYAIMQPLGELLRRHRLQALARSPLAARVRTVRELALLDAGNPVWQDDVLEFERARAQQIPAEAEEALKARDLEQLHQLTMEVDDGGWREPPPPALKNRLRAAERKLRGAQAREELERLEPLLTAAFAEYDEATGLSLLSRWDECFPHAALADDDPLYQRALPALEWLQRVQAGRDHEQEYLTAAADLEQALDNDRDALELERLRNAALRVRPLPDLLEQRYQVRLQALEGAQRRRRRLMVGAASLTLLIAGLATGGAIYVQRVNQQVAGHASSLRKLLAGERLADAARYWEELKRNTPALASRAELASFGLELNQKQALEKRRVADYTAALDQARAAGVMEPDMAALTEAKRLARSDGELAEAAELEQAIADRQHALQIERDEKFAGLLSGIAKRAAASEALHAKDPVALLAAVDGLEKELRALRDGSQRIGAAQLANADAVQKRIDQLQIESLQRRREADALPDLVAALGDLDAYQAALEKHIREFPESKRSADFKNFVASELPRYRALREWNQFAAKRSQRDLESPSAEEAKALVAEIEALLGSQSQFAWAQGLGELAAYLKSIATRSLGTEIGELKKLLTDRLMLDLWMIQTPGRQRYYLTKALNVEQNAATYKVEYLVGFDGSKTEKQFARNDFEVHGGDTWYGAAPHSAVAKRILDGLALLDQRPWEQVFLGACELVQREPRIEPLVQVLLLQRLLDVGTKGSPLMRELCEKPARLLNEGNIDLTAVWLDPKNEEGQRQRRLAELLMSQIPSFAELRKQALEQIAKWSDYSSVELVPLGILVEDLSGWSCLLGDSSRVPDGAAFVLAATDRRRVGTIQDGQVELAGPTGHLQGRIVLRDRRSAEKADQRPPQKK